MTGYYSNTRVDLGTQAQLSDKELQDEIDIVYRAIRNLHVALSQYEAPFSINLSDVSGRSLLDFYQLNSGSRLIYEAASTIAPGDFVGITELGDKIERIAARAPSVYTLSPLGWAVTGGNTGDPIILYANPAVLPFFSGLLPGRTYFIYGDGLLYPSVGSFWAVPVGFALSPTTMKLYTGTLDYDWQ